MDRFSRQPSTRGAPGELYQEPNSYLSTAQNEVSIGLRDNTSAASVSAGKSIFGNFAVPIFGPQFGMAQFRSQKTTIPQQPTTSMRAATPAYFDNVARDTTNLMEQLGQETRVTPALIHRLGSTVK